MRRLPLRSPPRMRGKGTPVLRGFGRTGITPAYAGKSLRIPRCATRWREHPRACGEKYFSFCAIFFLEPSGNLLLEPSGSSWVPPDGSIFVFAIGSPPRMRGKVLPLLHSPHPPGITPACAGKRLRIGVRYAQRKDHPRVCGEKDLTLNYEDMQKGSPPRMRGKVPRQVSIPGIGGITPAYAGKRLKRSHSIGHFSYILCLFHSVLHRASVSGGSRAGPCAPPCLPAQNAVSM